MAVKHIVTIGFGAFSQGVEFIPTLGFAPSNVVIYAGPFYAQASQGWTGGAVACDGFAGGAQAAMGVVGYAAASMGVPP